MLKGLIVVIGDSLALARPDEGIDYENTYPHLLRKNHLVINRSKFSGTSEDIYLCPKNADYCIIHLGLVDCFPRLFSDRQKKLLSYLPNQVRRLLIYPFTRYRYYFTKHFPKVSVDLKDFENNIEDKILTLKKFGVKPVLINIMMVSPEVQKKNYGAIGNIYDYNDVLSKLAFFHNIPIVDLNSISNWNTKVLHTDGQHLSILGHKILANELEALL